jgi:hypothetical protein
VLDETLKQVEFNADLPKFSIQMADFDKKSVNFVTGKI